MILRSPATGAGQARRGVPINQSSHLDVSLNTTDTSTLPPGYRAMFVYRRWGDSHGSPFAVAYASSWEWLLGWAGSVWYVSHARSITD